MLGFRQNSPKSLEAVEFEARDRLCGRFWEALEGSGTQKMVAGLQERPKNSGVVLGGFVPRGSRALDSFRV